MCKIPLHRYFPAFLFTMTLHSAYAADGTWNSTTSANWNVATNPPWAGGIIADGAGFTANFNTLDPTADVTVTLGVDRTIGNLIFGDTDTSTAAGWIITGNKLTLAAATGTAPVVTVNALGTSKEVTINSVLMGTQGFVKEGAGTLNIGNGNNGFAGITGGIVVNNGILKLSASNAIRGELTINSGGEVRQNASWSLGTDGAGPVSAFTNIININGGILNFAVLGGGMVANINMTGGEIKSVGNGNVDWYNTPVGGSRTLTTFASGSTALVSSGLNLRMGNNNGGTSIFDVADGGAAIDFKISGGISEQVGGSQNLLKKGAGTMELSASNSFAGTTKVAAGVLKLTHNLALQSSALDTGGAGTVTLGTTTLSLGGLSGGTDLASVITSGYTGSLTALTLNTYTGKNLFYSGVIANGATGMTLTKSGSGTQVLSGANTYTGGTIISGGKLIMTSAANLGNGALNVGGNTFIYAPTAAGALNIGSGVLTLTNNGTIGTALGGTASQSAITSTGTASLSGTGKVNIYGITGVSPTAGTNNLITAGSGLTGGTYTLGTVFNNTDFTVSGFTRAAGAISVAVTSQTALTGNVSWKGGLTGNTGVWAASNGSTQSNWQVTDGVNQPLAPGAATDLVFSTATSPGTMVGMSLGANMTVKTLTINNTATAFGLNADGFMLTLAPSSSATGITINTGVLASTVAANVALGADQTWTNNSANTMTVSGMVSGAYAFTKAGTGQITLSGNNTYTGATTISTGTLAFSGSNSFTGATTIASGATLTISGAGQLGTGSYAGNIANAGTLNYNGANNQTLGGIISGAGSLVKGGDGRDSKLSLTGVNTYTGVTTINVGKVEIGGVGQLNSGNYAGNIYGANETTFIYNSTANQTLSGASNGLYGSLAVTKTNTGTLTLSGNHSYTGLLSVQQGTLSIGTINNASANGVLGNSANAVVLGNTGGVTGTLSYTGGTTSSTKKFTMATGGTGAFDVTTGATNLALSGVVDGSGSLTKIGAGKLTLSGANTYSGATTVTAGILALDYATQNNNKISTAALTLGGGTVTLAGNASAATAQTVGGLTLTSGGSVIAVTSNHAGGARLALGAITRSAGNGGTINFTLPTGTQSGTNGITTTTNNTATSIFSGWATVDLNDWATYSAGNMIKFASYFIYDNVSGWISPGGAGLTSNMTDNNGYDATYTNSITLNSLRFNAGLSDSNLGVVSGQNLTIESGGILVTNNVGVKYQRIGFLNTSFNTGEGQGGLTTSGSELIINQNNSSTGHMEIYSTIFGSGVSLVKSGVGFLDMKGLAASYGGGTTINGGTLQLSGGNDRLPTGTAVTLNAGTLILNGVNQQVAGLNGGASSFVDHGGSGTHTLTINLAGGTNSYAGVIKNTAGTLALTKTGAGTQVLTGVNTYIGATAVLAGRLVVNGSTASGSAVVIGGSSATGSPTLSGAGTIGGATTISSAGGGVVGIHAPGDGGVGKQTFSSSLTYESGSIFEWNLAASPSESGRGTSYDAVNAASLGASSGAIFRVVLDGSQNFSGAFWDTTRVWSDIFKTGDAGSNLGIASIFTGTLQYYNSGGALATPTAQGTFSFSGSSLIWTAVPEPSSAMAGLLMAAGLIRRRRDQLIR